MPRPGPRPYDCIRRAWHTDTHQPIRGSIIQQIFRVVTEAHSSAIRKNREWQEKLPPVVLKAEEIMYSKANSEAEYMDLETLWERLNDVINTIIRRDESTETGQFLQPCIEAALVLGCVPVRSSRSERHNNTRSYLNARFQEPAQAAPTIPDKTTSYGPPPQPQKPSGNQLSFSRSTLQNQATSLVFSGRQMAPNSSYIPPCTSPHLQPNFTQPMPSFAIESNSSLNFGSVYPLYYGSHFRNVEFKFGFQSPQNSHPNNIIIGTPLGRHLAQPACFTSTRNLLPSDSVKITPDKCGQRKEVDSHGKTAETECDLSLRLGPSDPGASTEQGLARVTGGGGSSSQQETSKYSEFFAKNFEFCFFPRHTANDPSESSSSEPEGEVLDKNTTSRKCKDSDRHKLEDGYAQWLQELQPNQFDCQIRWPGL